MTRPTTRIAAAALALTALLSGCGSSGDAGSPAAEPAQPGSAVEAGGERAADSVQAGDSAGSQTEGGTSGPADAVASDRRVIRTGRITVEVETLSTSAARVRQLAVDVGGFVASETTGLDQPADPVPLDEPSDGAQGRAGAGESVIVLRVPESAFGSTLDALGEVGTELNRATSAQDVTGQVADLTSRVATARASLNRVRALLAEAEDLKDVVLLESELTRRESDLEAHQAQLTALAGRADLSTITAVLRTGRVADSEPNSFMRGLGRAWDALVASTSALFVVVGAVLPFAVLVLLVAVPLWRWRRRTGRPGRRPASQDAGPDSGTPDAADQSV